MYNTYVQPPEGVPFVLSLYDGDTYIYTVCETEDEYNREVVRRKKIDAEYNEKMAAYLRRPERR